MARSARKANKKTTAKKRAKKAASKVKTSATKKRRPAKKSVKKGQTHAKRAASNVRARPTSSTLSTTVLASLGTATTTTLAPTGLGANRGLLNTILGGQYADATPLEPAFDGLARAGLAARIRRAGVPVNRAVIIACKTVGCVRAEMNRVNPAGQ